MTLLEKEFTRVGRQHVEKDGVKTEQSKRMKGGENRAAQRESDGDKNCPAILP